MKILMIEDDATTVEAIQMCLAIYCPEVKLDSESHGQKALTLLQKGDYQGVMIDLSLPDIDGLEVIKKLRAFSQIPIIVVSARNDMEDITQAISLGANDFIVKPFDYWNLLRHLEKLFKIQQIRKPNA